MLLQINTKKLVALINKYDHNYDHKEIYKEIFEELVKEKFDEIKKLTNEIKFNKMIWHIIR